MKIEAQIELWKKEEARTFEGWDFGYLGGRMIESSLPWVYKSIVKTDLKPGDQLLDMGTGGGEFLLSLDHPYANTSVTEAYPPNIKLCRERLGSLGIHVQPVDEDGWLPFEDGSMDIIINRHESFRVSEVARVLKSGGLFITQQVGSWNNWEFSKALVGDISSRLPSNNVYEPTLKEMKKVGFHIRMNQECYPELKFLDIGGLVYFAKIIEWEFPNFSVDGCKDALLEMHKEILDKGYIASQEHRYIIVGKKL